MADVQIEWNILVYKITVWAKSFKSKPFIGIQNIPRMVSWSNPKMLILLSRCRNNGILEYWNDDILKNEPSSSLELKNIENFNIINIFQDLI